MTGMFNTFYPNVFILFSIAFTPTIVFVDARLCNLATLVLETIGFTVTTPSLTPITFPRAIVSVILTPDKLFVFLTISTFALDGIVTTKLSPTFGVLLISPILITNLSLEAETIFACNFFFFPSYFISMYRRLPMSRLALDRGYETGAVHRGLELLGITGYIPAIQFSNPPEKYGFSYDPQLDAFICPEGVPLTYHRLNCSKSTGKYLRCYQVEGDACMRCPKRPSCFDKAGIRRRVLASSCYPAFFRGHQRVGTPEYLAMMRLRKIWAEGSFSVLKREHCISRIRKRGILAATEECLLAAMALNLKRMVNAIFRYPQIYCSAGTSVGFSSFFAFVNRSLIVPYPHESPGRIRYDSVCKTAAKTVNIVKVEHTLPLRDGVCSTNAQIRDGSSYLVIRKSGTTVTPHLYSLE